MASSEFLHLGRGRASAKLRRCRRKSQLTTTRSILITYRRKLFVDEPKHRIVVAFVVSTRYCSVSVRWMDEVNCGIGKHFEGIHLQVCDSPSEYLPPTILLIRPSVADVQEPSDELSSTVSSDAEELMYDWSIRVWILVRRNLLWRSRVDYWTVVRFHSTCWQRWSWFSTESDVWAMFHPRHHSSDRSLRSSRWQSSVCHVHHWSREPLEV